MKVLSSRPSFFAFAALAFIAATALSANGQWSSNAALNLAIGNKTGEQIQGKIRTTSDGGCYVSWFDNSTGGYDVYLQRLNRMGVEQWAHNGVLVADLGLSSTNDYGLAVDSNDNAVLAFQDDRFGGTRITVSKVNAAGVLLWGSNGVQVTPNSSFAPQVAFTSDNHIVAGWTEDAGIKIQRLDPNGAIEWAAGGLSFVPATGSYAVSDVKASDNGSAIVLWVRTTRGFNSPRQLYTQKFNVSGAGQWNAGSPRIIFDSGSIPNGNFPTFVSDGAGGAIYGWHESSGAGNGYVQRVNSAGIEEFPHNGVACSTNTSGRFRISSSVSHSAGTNEIFLYWSDASLPNQNSWGVYGQKFNGVTGARQWTDTAKELVPLGSSQTSFVTGVADSSGNSEAFWFDNSGSAHVLGARLNSAGTVLWGGSPIQVCSTASGKARLWAAMTSCGTALVTWGDARTDVNDIYGQNVKANGTLGNTARPADIVVNGVVNIDDLLAVILHWGACVSCASDIVPVDCPNGMVNIDDLLTVILDWG